MEALCKPQLPGEDQTLNCKICGRVSDAELCSYHSAAKEKVEAADSLWVNAYGKIDWKEYLDGVKRNVQTGRWAKELAEYLEDE
jgi:hypothetical protein